MEALDLYQVTKILARAASWRRAMAGRQLRSRRIEAAQEEIVKGVSNVVQLALRNVSESPVTDITGSSRSMRESTRVLECSSTSGEFKIN